MRTTLSNHRTIESSRTESDAPSRLVIQEIFAHPPKSSIDLRERLSAVDRTSARRAAVDKLSGDDLSDRDGPLILAVLDVIGIGQERGRLVSAALDTKGEARVRMWAAMALAGDDPRMMDLLVTELGPEGMAHLAENALIDLMTIQQPNRVGGTVLRSLEEWHRDLSLEKLLSRIEQCRRGIGISCAEAYGPAVQSPRLPHIQPLLLDLFVQEGSEEGVAFLETLRRKEQDDGVKHNLHAALLRLRSANIDPDRRAGDISGVGRISNCDGNGGYIVLGIFNNPDDTRTVAEVYLQVEGEVLETVLHPRLKPDQIEQVVDQLTSETGCRFAPVSLAEAAMYVAAGVERLTDDPDGDPGELRQTVRLFSRIASTTVPPESPVERALLPLTEAAVHAQLSRPEYEDTWLFDETDLEAVGTALTDAEENYEAWLRDTQAAVARSSKRARLIAMSEHMARWHVRNDDPQAAAVALALAEETRRNAEGGLLIRAMLERSNPKRPG